MSPISGADGIDNQFSSNVAPLFASMPEGDFTNMWRDAIVRGDWLVAIEVTGIDSIVSDPSVRVELWRARGTDGVPVTGSDGRPVAGQSLTALESFGAGTGAIVAGRLRVGVPRIPLPMFEDEITFRDLTLEADVGMRLSSGEAGGSTTVTELTRALAASISGIDESTIRAVAGPDLDPTADPTVCDAISAGFTFDAVEATLAP